jgi:hypothetical protein
LKRPHIPYKTRCLRGAPVELRQTVQGAPV